MRKETVMKKVPVRVIGEYVFLLAMRSNDLAPIADLGKVGRVRGFYKYDFGRVGGKFILLRLVNAFLSHNGIF